MPSPETGANHPTTPLLETIQNIVAVCFSAELLERQRQFSHYHSEYQPIEIGARATLAAYQDSEGAWQHTFIGNVRQIRAHSHIDAGATIGDHSTLQLRSKIGAGAVVEPFATLEHDTSVEPESRIEEGAHLFVGVRVGRRATIGSGAEINYDVILPDFTKVLPSQAIN